MNESEHIETLIVLGRGRVGTSLCRAARSAGLNVELAPASAPRAQITAAGHGAFVILAVPGHAIRGVCERLVASGARPTTVGHVDGARGTDDLQSARKIGAEAVALHPMQTFAGPETELSGVACAVTGTDAASARGAELATRIGMAPFQVAETARPLYHAAASMASNLLVPLEEAAAELMRSAGVGSPRAALAPLVRQTVSNWAHMGPTALTGPVARGDERTIDQHRESIRKASPDVLSAYDALVERAREVVKAGATE